MNYYYDIVLNFQENLFMFYEWDEHDNLEYIKKIPLIFVDSTNLIDLIANKIIINNNLLKKIENKTKLKNNKFLKYCCIVADGKNSIAIEFNEDGESINKSSLLVDDELNINEFVYTLNKEEINYKKTKKEFFYKDIRQELIIKRIIKLEIKNMYDKKNYSKLKYIDDMYNNMLKQIEQKISEKEYHIYEIIKLSYNNV